MLRTRWIAFREQFMMSTVLITVAAVCWGAEPEPTGPNRPNIVVILTDDQRADAMGCAGNRYIRTPNLDALAAAGVRFANAFVTTSICSPSRAALLTGRYGSSNGVTGLGNPTVKSGEPSWARYLKVAGYRTAVIGKWHLKNSPESLGFETATWFQSNGSYYGRSVREGGRVRRVEAHVDDYVAEESERFLRESGATGQPFALLICTQLPHMDDRFRWNAKPDTLRGYNAESLPVPASWEDSLAGKPPYLRQGRHRTRAVGEYGYDHRSKVRSHLRDYYAAITDVDAALGRVLRAIDTLGLRERTCVVFTSDNGWFLGEHRFTSKVLAYEESIRVPLIIRGPGIQPGLDERLVLNIDIAPTILEWAGMPAPRSVQGVPLFAAGRSRRERPWRTAVLYEALEPELGSWPLLALRTDRWKYILTFQPDTSPPKPAFEELYDLADDPAEMNNLAGKVQHAETLRRLQAAMARRRPDLCGSLTTQPEG